MSTTWKFPFTPEPPSWSLDFDGLQRRFSWMQTLAACQQEPEWHAEGDVLTHTGMVLRELCAMEEWRGLAEEERHIVFAAALLHDIAKPQKTKLEDGKLRSKGHARAGALMARHLCMTELPEIPFAAREMIVGLVRHHGVPAYFLDRADPDRALISASMICRLDLLCILATADARGRVTKARDDMPERVALFREAAIEQGCLTGSYRFANDHSRVAYFRTPEMLPATELFDDSRCCATILSGLPAAGKDSWIRTHAGDTPVISLDGLRGVLDVNPGEDQSAVIATAKEEARGYLRQRRDFIWNATSTSRMLRDSLANLFLAYHARLRIVYCEAPLALMRERNGRRARPVPPEVIGRLIERLEVPDCTEAHEVDYRV
jgi:putative nucleotidyltransferase with HDIG domain